MTMFYTDVQLLQTLCVLASLSSTVVIMYCVHGAISLSYSPQVALKIMVPKLRSPTEKVALLALTVSLGKPLVGLDL